MANPTTNYGFVLPTSSDLVTDLPADFDVALQGVDTRLKALQPGTTEGDLAYSSATADTNTRLAIGSTGNVLTVAGGVPTWAAPATPAFVGVDCYAQAVSFAYTAGVNKQITFTTENFDTNGFHDNSSNTSRITIPTGYAGKYNIQATWASDSAGSYGNIYLYKNGSAITNIGTDGGKIVGVGGMSNNYFALNGAVTISLAEADYLEIYIQFSNTVTINTYAKFSATFLGA